MTGISHRRLSIPSVRASRPAARYDALVGNDAWRSCDESSLYDHTALAARTLELERFLARFQPNFKPDPKPGAQSAVHAVSVASDPEEVSAPVWRWRLERGHRQGE